MSGYPSHGVPGWEAEGSVFHGAGSGALPGGWRGDVGARVGGCRRREHIQARSGKQGLPWVCRGTGHPVGLPRVDQPRSPGLSPQSSQPSTTSPFKQEVFVYSPSPSSESPSQGAAATPIIMSRSPTGQWCLAICAM